MNSHTQQTLPNRVDLLTLMNGKPGTDRIVIGQTLNGGEPETVTASLARLGHAGIVGSCGWGKTVLLQSLALQLALVEDTPETVAPLLVFIDLEDAAAAPFRGFDRLLYPIPRSEEEAVQTLEKLTEETQRRLNLMRERGVTMWEQYNALPDVEPLRPIAVFIDDATTILESNSAIHDMLAEIIIQLRKTGVFFILSSQEMSSKSMRPMIRRQLSSRFAFHVADAWQTQGLGIGREAVDLNVKGRAWIILPGQQKMLVQTPFVASYEIKQLLTQSGRLTTNKEQNNG